MTLLRSPFARKLLGALLGTLSILALGLVGVVRQQTARQVAEVTEQRVATAVASLSATERLKRRAIAPVLDRFSSGSRAAAALDATLRSGDVDRFADDVAYDLALNRLDDVLVVFHDIDGRGVVTLAAGRRFEDAGAFGLAEAVAEATVSPTGVWQGYRVAADRLYRVETRLLDLGTRAVGGISIGVPVTDEDVLEVSELAGVDVCFEVGGSCAVASPAGASLAALFRPSAEMYRVSGTSGRRAFVTPPLEGAGEIRLGLAVPLDSVLRPFDRITRALLLGLVVSLLVATFVAALLARRLTRPVVALTHATRRVAEGDYDHSVEVHSSDEIGILANAFNAMTEGLRLKERYRGVLDKVVSPDVASELVREGALRLGGETREVTVLFGDLRGFTALAEEMAPEAVIDLLNGCMERLSDAVETEGGIVDKFVGDEIMAVFGAPTGASDHALRGVRCAARMQEAMRELNEERIADGAAPLGLGVGINSGEAVAGNMGSPNRLNYTVVGRVVNLAARLCSSAEPGETLLGPTTAGEIAEEAQVGDEVRIEEVGAREFKGVRQPIVVSRLKRVTSLLALVCTLTAGPASAQSWPSLEEIGWFASPNGLVQGGTSGRLDLDLLVAPDSSPGLPRVHRVVAAPRVSLFGDVLIGEALWLRGELRIDRGDVPADAALDARVEQLVLQWTGPHKAVVRLGKMPSPVGGYAERHNTAADPFVRPPVPWDHRTVVSPSAVPASRAEYVTWSEGPAFRRAGLPPLWQVPYPWGATLDLGVGPFLLQAGVTNSSPSSPPSEWSFADLSFDAPTWSVAMETHPIPSLRTKVWWSRGPYRAESAPGRCGSHRCRQQLVGALMEYRRGGLLARLEAFSDEWEVPGDPYFAVTDLPWSIMLQQDVRAGLDVALRIGGVDFRPLRTDEGTVAWDRDVVRAELGVGYRLARNAGLRATLAEGWTDRDDPSDALVALRLWWEF